MATTQSVANSVGNGVSRRWIGRSRPPDPTQGLLVHHRSCGTRRTAVLGERAGARNIGDRLRGLTLVGVSHRFMLTGVEAGRPPTRPVVIIGMGAGARDGASKARPALSIFNKLETWQAHDERWAARWGARLQTESP